MKVVFMGTPPAAVSTLSRLIEDGHQVVAVYTQPDRPAGRGNKLNKSAVKIFAEQSGLEVRQPLKIRTPEALETFRSHEAEAAVVVAYGRILPETFLAAFPMGAINVHFSLLPKYRGAAPVNWAIANGETLTGVTTMRMDAGLDTGDILLQHSTEIGPVETAPVLMERLAELGADLLSETLRRFETLAPTKQDGEIATLAPILRKSDGLVDWSMDARSISDRIRGFQPFPGTFSSFRDIGIKFWAALAEEDDGGGGEPGQIVAVRGEDLRIVCGKGTILRVDELQPEGKRRMSARDFVNGMQPKVGERFNSNLPLASS